MEEDKKNQEEEEIDNEDNLKKDNIIVEKDKEENEENNDLIIEDDKKDNEMIIENNNSEGDDIRKENIIVGNDEGNKESKKRSRGNNSLDASEVKKDNEMIIENNNSEGDDIRKKSENDKTEKKETKKIDRDKYNIDKTKKKEAEKPNEENEQQNRLLRNVLIVSGIMFIVFLSGYFIMDSFRHFEYRGITGDVVNEIAPYRISLPVLYQGNVVPYYFYIRNDPRDLDKKVPFTGSFLLKENVVVNGSESFECEGDDIIALANLVKLYGVIGAKVIRDENATCDSEGKYTFLQIQEGDETSIVQYGHSCYQINFKDCEILEATERFMAEIFVDVNEKLNK